MCGKLEESKNIINKKEDMLEKIFMTSGNLYIVGAGKFGNILGLWLNKNNIKWKGYIDKNKTGKLNEKLISKECDVIDSNYFLISSYVYQEELKQILYSQKIEEKQIFFFTDCVIHNQIMYQLYEEIYEWKKYVKRNNQFEGCHKNVKRCFIIGNGPSLRVEDLNLLKNEVTFASNSIYALYSKTQWRPTYYLAFDPTFCEVMMSSIEKVRYLTGRCKFAFTSIIGDAFCFKDDESLKNLCFLHRSLGFYKGTDFPLFSDDCSEVIYIAGTVTYASLQLAVYMGFEEIYLLGMDCTFSCERYKDGSIKINSINNHNAEIENFCRMDEKEKEIAESIKDTYGVKYVADIDLQIAGYESAKQYCESHGIKIYNATRGGKLEVFERVDFDKLFH